MCQESRGVLIASRHLESTSGLHSSPCRQYHDMKFDKIAMIVACMQTGLHCTSLQEKTLSLSLSLNDLRIA